MTIITKGMGKVLKSIKTLKKSKKFPGPGAEKQLIKKLGKKAFMTMVRLGSAELSLLGINKKGGKVK